MTTVAASASPLPAGITDPNYKPLPGREGNLTIPQQHALEKLKKELVADNVYIEGERRMSDAALLKYLRARKFDVPKAKEMFLNTEKWRKEFGVDDIVKNFDFPEHREVDKYYPQYYHKNDKDGRPVYIERLGQLDLKALYAATTQERQLKRFVLEYEKFISERLPACSAAAGHPVETSCTIMDLHNVSLSNFYRVKDYVMQASRIGQDHYPECMGKFYIINAPFMFSTVWSFIKPWLDEVTVAKIDIIGSGYKDKLLAQISADNLPKEFGGNCSCPGGCSLSDAGPWNTSDKVVESESGGKVLSA
ncbi:CRAL-TRIO domain-containing protein [Mycena albidolilacea]|uniref:CRAL-TRIO domain-containing protein n=1 Tax=Mycena albidolilacea TaxID=1033008 RepID=A0AAD7A9E1_9AGAR|nr:CRAL-TRIO domain-containing protein [Mycena albidolilacea]